MEVAEVSNFSVNWSERPKLCENVGVKEKIFQNIAGFPRYVEVLKK